MCNSTDDRGGSFSFPCGYWQSFYRLDMDVQGACANLTCAHAEGGGGSGEVARGGQAVQAARLRCSAGLQGRDGGRKGRIWDDGERKWAAGWECVGAGGEGSRAGRYLLP